MIHDNLDPQFEPTANPARTPVERREAAQELDHEVPLNTQMPSVIHAWLDGEPVEQESLRSVGGFEFWNQMTAETDRRRRMRTPAPLVGAIMEAIQREQ